MVPPLLPLLVEEWRLSAVEAGMINTLYAVGRLATSYPASRIRARWGTRAAIYLGLAVLVAGVVACGLASTFALFLAARLLMGVGASAAFLAVFGELLESAPAAWRGRVTNAFEGMAILSLGAGGVLGAWVAGRAGWRPVFVGAGPVLLLTLLAWGRLDPAAGRRPPGARAAAGSGAGPGHQRLTGVYAGSLSLAMTWSGLFATLVPLLGYAGYGLAPGPLGLALGAGYLAELLGLLGIGLVVDRVRPEPLFLGGALSVLAGGLLLAVGREPSAFVLGLVLVGGGFCVWMIPATVLADRVGTPMPAAYLAAYRIAMDAGTILGPLLLGWVAGRLGERVAAGSAGLLLVAGAALLRRR